MVQDCWDLRPSCHGLQGKRVAVSGSGNVAIYTIEKLLELGAIPVTASDSTGYVYEENGITREQLDHINDVKVVKRGTLKEYKSSSGTLQPPSSVHLAEGCIIGSSSGRY